MDRLNNVLKTAREDDFVEYYVFLQDGSQGENTLDHLLMEANKVITLYSQQYLWHKDPIKLTVRSELSHLLTEDGSKEKLPPHLYGVSHYGDNIEDEWFIVFLLVEITKALPNTIARVCDSDGEFLLIEAADYLPHWANPETCQNRVFLHRGLVHLLPLIRETESLSVDEALPLIGASSEAPTEIQQCIKDKLSNYPDGIKNNQHKVTIYVPTGVAAILKEAPRLISAAVQAFCNRDPVDMKACRAMKFFPPEQRVYVRVTFTRCQYAMLMHSKYQPERKIGWNLPPSTSKRYKAHSLGVKVACGFEILASQAKPSVDIQGDRGWVNYLNSLKGRGYFGDLLDGSKEYVARLEVAKEYYKEHRDSMHYSPVLGTEVLRLLRSCEVDHQVLNEEPVEADDDDTWLDISPDELDRMLQERYGQRKMFKVDESTDPAIFADKITDFLNRECEVEGAEFPDQEAPIKPPRKKKGVSFQREETNENPSVDFDVDSFANAVHSMLNFAIPEDESFDSDSDMSEYDRDEKMNEYMRKMDEELAATEVGKSFERKRENGGKFEDVEEFRPVDIDVNALKNILESYRAQMGDAGPSSNMLGPMGLHLDPK